MGIVKTLLKSYSTRKKLKYALSAKTEQNTEMKCKQEHNKSNCNCTYEPCSRKGVCCSCIQYHLKMKQLPACVFPDDAEKTYDRSFGHFIEQFNDGKV